MDISDFLNLSYGGRVLPPRFVDTNEDFEFLTDLLFKGYKVNSPDTAAVYTGYSTRTSNAKNVELFDKIAIALIGNRRVSEEEWITIEDYLFDTLADRDTFIKVLNLAAHCVNGNHARFARTIVVMDNLDVNDRRIVDALWRSFSMMYHWVFMTYAYQEVQRIDK